MPQDGKQQIRLCLGNTVGNYKPEVVYPALAKNLNESDLLVVGLLRQDFDLPAELANQTVRDALSVLVNQKIGALLVFDEKEKIVGILSERDIMRECFTSPKSFDLIPISNVMTKKVIVGKPDDKVEYIMGIMTQNRVRHIPIVADGKLEGLISIGDAVKAQLQHSEYENQYLKEYMFGGETSPS